MRKLIIFGLTAVMAVVSCDNEDVDVIYDGSNRETLLSFEVTTVDLPITINSDGAVTIPVEASSLSDVDRTYNVSIVDEATDVVAGSVSVPNTVTIPAGSYEGDLTITGTDINGDVEVDARPLVLELSSPNAADNFTNQRVTVNVFQVCPVDNTAFTGDYQLTQLSGGYFAPPNSTVFEPGEIITLTNADNNLQRQFVSDYAPFNAFPDRTYRMNFVCNKIRFVDQGTGNGCSVQLFLGPTTDPAVDFSEYDPNDDSQFTISLRQDTTEDCGPGNTATILATKV
ncbi:hypothetical protein AAU57_06000 [Nonlabens sp. YIK11]|uniref:hypothetical protein n=1 Tax=Nonlabens sp. YIK11 TaxID=1453349 RepID=UPI0006DD3534|nr:hypothetical protein [Nonlabens sp. YIK11]KQC32919.1 hypothetical protein AAU57_06000 [Nonlabens sp. YIK11]